MRLPNTGGVAAWKSFGMESLNPQFSMNREFEVAPETMKVPRHPCTISAQHHRRTARPTSSSATVSKVVGRFETHIMGSANWMEQNTHWTCSYCHFLCLQSSSLVLKILEWALVLLQMLAKCLKFWVVTLLAFSFVILMNGTPEGNPILSCLCFMLNYETFGIVWPCLCVFMHFSVCIGVAVRAIVPVYRVSDSNHGRTVLYVLIQQPRVTIAMFLTTKTTLTDFYFQIVLCPILFWLYINDVTVDCIKIIHTTNSPLGIRGLHLICSQASKLESRDTWS